MVKEVEEEAGLLVVPQRILAVWDKRYHDHPPDLHHTYKILFLCKITGGKLASGFETIDANFFGEEEIPPLSTNRTTSGQIKFVFEYQRNPHQDIAWN